MVKNDYNRPEAEEKTRNDYKKNKDREWKDRVASELQRSQAKATHHASGFFLDLKPTDRLGVESHYDGDGITCGVVVDEFCSKQKIPHWIEFSKGEKELIENTRKFSSEYNINKLLITDKKISKEAVIQLVKDSPNLESIFIIDHHDDYYELFSLPPDADKKFDFCNIKFGLEDGPAACAPVFKAISNLKIIDSDKKLYPYLAAGAASDLQLKFSLDYIEMPPDYRNAYAHGEHLLGPLKTIVEEEEAAYSIHNYADFLFKKIKESIAKDNPALMWEEKMREVEKQIPDLNIGSSIYKGDALDLAAYKEIRESEKNGRTIVDGIKGHHITYIGPKPETEKTPDLKRKIARHSIIQSPKCWIGVFWDFGNGYSRISLRKSAGGLDKFSRYWNLAYGKPDGVNRIEGHGGARGGFVETLTLDKLVQELDYYFA